LSFVKKLINQYTLSMYNYFTHQLMNMKAFILINWCDNTSLDTCIINIYSIFFKYDNKSEIEMPLKKIEIEIENNITI